MFEVSNIKCQLGIGYYYINIIYKCRTMINMVTIFNVMSIHLCVCMFVCVCMCMYVN